jgi:hypothetical protein
MPNFVVGLRPHKPPVLSDLAEDHDRFHQHVHDPELQLLTREESRHFDTARARAKEHMSERMLTQKPGDDITIITLGTSSAVPTKFRNGQCLEDLSMRFNPTMHAADGLPSFIYADTDSWIRQHHVGRWRRNMGCYGTPLWSRPCFPNKCVGCPPRLEVYIRQPRSRRSLHGGQ